MPILVARKLADRPPALVLLGVVFFATVGQGMVLPFLFVYLTHVRHFDPTMAGLVGAWIGLAGLLIAVPTGGLLDRYGSRRVFVAIMAVYALGIALYASVQAPWQAFLAATLASAGGAPLIGAYNTLLSTVTDPERQQRYFGLAFATLNLGLGVGGLIGGAVANVHRPRSFEALYLADAAVLAASGLCVLALRKAGQPQHGASEQQPPVGGYRDVLADRAFRRFLGLGVLLMSCAYAQLEFGFPAFATNVAHVSTRVLGWSFAANSLTILCAQMLVLRFIDGRSRSRVLSLVALVIASSWVVLGAGAAARHVAPVLPAVGVAACAVVFAFGEVLMSPVVPALTNSLATDALRGRYNAMASMLFGATSIIGPITAAPLIGHGLAAVWVVLVVAGALTASVLATSLRSTLTAEQDGLRPDGVS